MSYKNVFYGSIGPLTFNSRAGDVLDGSEMRRYLPENFLIHPFTKLKLIIPYFFINDTINDI